MIPWVRKYQPKKLTEVVGQRESIDKIVAFYQSFPRDRTIILSGPHGSGKTAIVTALATQLGAELIELNASDYRREQDVMSVLEPASRQGSIFGKKKIILIDEIDGLAGMQDRGAITSVIKIITETRFPIFITTNNVWNKKLKTLRKSCRILELRKLETPDVLRRLHKIAKLEKIKIEDSVLKKIAAHSDGDVRAAINDLQAICSGVELFNRDRIEEVESAMRMIFKSFDSEAAKSISNSLEIQPRDFLQWLDQNISSEYYDKKSIRDAYDYLSQSDIFLERIPRWQHWRFLVYVYLLSAVGVQQSKTKPNPKQVRYSKPDLMKYWIRAAKLRKAKGLAQTIGPKLHASARSLQRDFIPYFNFIEQKNPKMAKEINEWLGV